jgi:YcaO-like protein with predicted kinase domain
VPASDPATAKTFRLGTHRTVPPARTWERIAPLLPRFGITRVADVTALDAVGIPVYQAVRPDGLSLSVSQGKGATPEAARVSAAMEAVELWHAEHLDGLPQIEMSVREMRYANPVGVEDLPWTTPHARRFDGAAIPWLRALPLLGRRPGWLPRAVVDLDLRPPEAFVPTLFHVSSNGLASGNCLEEALLHGLCELVERHALAVAREDRQRHRVPLDAERVDPGCREMIGRLRRAGGRVRIFDVTCGIAVPAFFVEAVFPDLPRVWMGSGCHPAPEVALSRALTEAAQSRLTYIAGARDDIVPVAPWQEAAPHRAFDSLAEAPGGRALADVEGFSGATVAEDLEWVLDRLAANGLRPYYVDLTRPDLGIAVAKAFVAGLREAHHA